MVYEKTSPARLWITQRSWELSGKKRRKMTSILGPRKLLWNGIWQLTNSQTANDLRCYATILERHKCTVKNQADMLHFAIKFFTYLAPAFSKRFCINLLSHDCWDNPGVRTRSGPPPALPVEMLRCGGNGRLIWQLLSHRLSQEVRATFLPQANGPRETPQVNGAWVWWGSSGLFFAFLKRERIQFSDLKTRNDWRAKAAVYYFFFFKLQSSVK